MKRDDDYQWNFVTHPREDWEAVGVDFGPTAMILEDNGHSPDNMPKGSPVYFPITSTFIKGLWKVYKMEDDTWFYEDISDFHMTAQEKADLLKINK